jgi:predicted lipoprotein with Yx(FWY)xxD motif
VNPLSKGSKLGLLVLIVALLATAALGDTANNYTINTATNKTMGTYLVNQTGFTLYYFAKDMPGNSTCIGSCATLWPPFYARKE